MFIFFAVVAAALGITAGLTAGKLINKAGSEVATIGGLLPAGTLDPIPSQTDPATGKTTFPFLKVITIAVLGAIGIMVVKWVGKKLHIKLLK
jgi:hypothetical protein